MELTPRCPLCRAPVSWEGNPHRPFCSERCRLIDLGSWASEDYRIPVADQAEPAVESDSDESESS
jgi:uncharacterized protein